VGTVHAALDAGRGEFFYARVVGGAVVAEGLVGRDALSASVRERESGGGRSVVVVCEASAAEALGDLRPVLVEPLVAGDSLEMVAERIGAGRVADVASLDANYLRRTEQEVLDRLLARRPGQ
jgi:tRNA threonylcarbamoyladenosine biosynthesis protein TsaB